MKHSATIIAAIVVSLFSVTAHSDSHTPGAVGGLVANQGAILVQDNAMVDSFDSTLGGYGRGNVSADATAYAHSEVIVQENSSFEGKIFPRAEQVLSLVNVPVPSGLTSSGDFTLATYTYQYLAAGDYYFDSFTVDNGSYLDIDGEVRIWVKGNVAVHGQLQVRSYNPHDLWILGSTETSSVDITGHGASMMGHVYAPSAAVTMAQGEVYGSLTGKTVDLQADSSFHFDTSTPGLDAEHRSVVTASVVPAAKAPVYSRTDHMVLGPVPSLVGQPVCLFSPSPTSRTDWNVFNAMGERVAQLEFNDPSGQCWTPSGLAPGVYLVHIAAAYLDGTASAQTRKIVVQN